MKKILRIVDGRDYSTVSDAGDLVLVRGSSCSAR